MNTFITLDYEPFFGSSIGNVNNSIITPTYELLKLAEKYNFKLIFFVDSGFLIKLQEYKDQNQTLESDYNNLIRQLNKINDDGHDIQLHIHPHWEMSIYDGEKWIINTSKYRLHDFNEIEIENIVNKYKKALTDIVGNKVFAFRAGGWCIQPFKSIKNSLKQNNIWLDSTVFSGGYNKSKIHYYDYRKIPKKASWRFDEDILKENKEGYFLEIPISSYVVNPLFFYKYALSKLFPNSNHHPFGDGKAIRPSKIYLFKILLKASASVVSIDGLKANFLVKAYNRYYKRKEENFVIIGHPKALTPYSLKKLEDFIISHRENILIKTFTESFNNK